MEQRRLGIVSMMRDGQVSEPVRRCFAELLLRSSDPEPTICRYDDPALYSLIADGPETHWFFTGNTPDFVTDEDAPGFDPRILTISTKMLFFVCYSHQYVCKLLGAPIRQLSAPRIGRVQVKFPTGSVPFFAYYTQYIEAGDIPAGWQLLGETADGHIALMYRDNMYSCQVHPERCDATRYILEAWLAGVASQDS